MIIIPACSDVVCLLKLFVFVYMLAGHDMGDPFEVSTIRREVSLFGELNLVD